MRSSSLLAVIFFAGFATAQSTPDMASAPHYRLLLSNNQVRVFAVTLRPTERTMARHDHNFLVITLQDCEVIIWPEGASDITNFRFSQGDVRFGLGGRASGIRNDKTTAYRNVTVEFLDPKVTSYGYQLLSRDTLPPPEEKSGPELLIPITDIDLKSSEYERIRKSSGDAVWIPAGRKSAPLNATADAGRLVLINFPAPA
jgi:hypothetical protein